MAHRLFVIKKHANLAEAHLYEHAITNELLHRLHNAHFLSIIDFIIRPETFGTYILIDAEFSHPEAQKLFSDFITANQAPSAHMLKMAALQTSFEDHTALKKIGVSGDITDQPWQFVDKTEAEKRIADSIDLTETKGGVDWPRVSVIFEFASSDIRKRLAFSYLAACLQEAFQTQLIVAGVAAYQNAQRMSFSQKKMISVAGYSMQEADIQHLVDIRHDLMATLRANDFADKLADYILRAPSRDNFKALATQLQKSHNIEVDSSTIKMIGKTSYLKDMLNVVEMFFEMKGAE